MSANQSIGFLGAGQMTTALARGVLRAQWVRAEQLLASDVSEGARQRFQEATGGRVTADNAEVVAAAGTLILAVKPGQVPAVLSEVRSHVRTDQLVLSIAAGVAVAQLEAALPVGARVIRVMPNTPALVGEGVSAFALGKAAGREDAAWAEKVLGAVGLAVEVPEGWLDAVTGLSGSGPAYACLMIEALSDGGVAAGLPRELATRLAAQTLLGTARLVLDTGKHPAVLKDMVTSPGGTTIEGLQRLEQGGVRGALLGAVRAAAERARQLGRG